MTITAAAHETEVSTTAVGPSADPAPLITPTTTFSAPRIGQPWPGQGGIYVGLARGIHGAADEHLVLLPGATATKLTHAQALQWASEQTADGHTDYHLPSRDESALLYAHVRDRIDVDYWHWTSSEGYSASYAWNQDFLDGYQNDVLKGAEGAAVAVRRFAA